MQQSHVLRFFRFPRGTGSHLFLLIVMLCVKRGSDAAPPPSIPMQAPHWSLNGSGNFTPGADDADGVLDIGKGSAELKDLVFADGTIEFDMFMPDHGILGLRLRAQDRDNAEALYFRPKQNCSVAPDCLQYMPLEHGAFEWDLFPEAQSAAPIHTLAWNHVRLVVLGRAMRVYLNHASRPALAVDHMEGAATSGALIFGGPARYAHLVVTPAPPPPVVRQPGAGPDDGFLRKWQLSTASVLPTVHDKALGMQTGVPPAYADMPAAGATWRSITAQAKGLVNFSHELGSTRDPAVISLAWAKTSLVSDKAQTKTVRIGWVRDIWVYVNGTLVYADRNLGDLPAAQIADQRISLENGTFRLPLNQGSNEIAIALDDNLPGNMQHFGWGMEVELDDMRGISMAPVK